MSRSIKLLVVMSLIIVAIVPVAAFGATSLFEDVPDDSIFVNDINWMKTNGVTKGCNPPTNTKYCPTDNVTRQQMAAFMHRLAINKVVDAKTAVNADNLDGMDSTAFVPATALLPVASAMIDRRPSGSGDLVAGSGWSKATRVSTGVYCLTLDPALGVDPAKLIVNVTVEWGRSLGSDLLAMWWRRADSCPAGQIEIRTYDTASAASDRVVFVATAFTSGNYSVYDARTDRSGASDGNVNE